MRRDRPISGHSGAIWNTEIPGGWVLDTANLWVPGFEIDFAPNGYMLLEFRDDRLIEYVRAPDGANIYLKDLL
jgi:hypothetical protein